MVQYSFKLNVKTIQFFNLYAIVFVGLKVPFNCELIVNNEKLNWVQKKVILFDDSFYHSAHYFGTKKDGPRIVLMIDFWHPDLTTEERNALKYIFPPV